MAAAALSIWAAAQLTVLAQVPPETEAQRGDPVESPIPEVRQAYIRKTLPPWIQIGAEWRGRVESGNAFDLDQGTPFYLNRLRINIGLQPARRVQFFLQAQATRTVNLRARGAPDELQNILGMRQPMWPSEATKRDFNSEPGARNSRWETNGW